jgi:TrmH RNA methyltransferase
VWAQDGKPILVLDGVGNPHNLGAIARSAAFLGLERVVLADRPEQAIPSDASYRIAEGGLEHLSLFRAPLPAALPLLRRAYRIVGAAPIGRAAAPDLRGERPPALVLGNEATGLDPQTLAACDAIATIPGCGRMQSLNVAAAAAILIYLAMR